jgi:hypothetical protein
LRHETAASFGSRPTPGIRRRRRPLIELPDHSLEEKAPEEAEAKATAAARLRSAPPRGAIQSRLAHGSCRNPVAMEEEQSGRGRLEAAMRQLRTHGAIRKALAFAGIIDPTPERHGVARHHQELFRRGAP